MNYEIMYELEAGAGQFRIFCISENEETFSEICSLGNHSLVRIGCGKSKQGIRGFAKSWQVDTC